MLRRNVPISLTLRGVDCAGVLAAVSAQWGFPFLLLDRAAVLARLPEAPSPEMLARAEPGFRRLEERADFCWEAVPLADVLRDIAGHFSLTGHWLRGGVQLNTTDEPLRSRAAVGVSSFDNGSVRVYPRSISHTLTRSRWFHREFAEAEPHHHSDQVMLSLACEFPGQDADRLAGLRNCVALDDCGRRLEARKVPDVWEFHAMADLTAFPDEWQGRLAFPAPSPGARRLASLEGDLMIFEEYSPMRFEFPLPLTETVRQIGPVTVEITHFDAGNRPSAEDAPPSSRHRRGPEVEARIRKPKGAYLTSLGECGHISPVLFGTSGVSYDAQPVGSGTCGRDDDEAEVSAGFAPATDAPTRLVFDLALKSRPTRLVNFQLRDIPLP